MTTQETLEYDRFAPTKIKDEYMDEYNAPSYYDSTIEEEEYLETLPIKKGILRQYDNNRNNQEHHSYAIGYENNKNHPVFSSGKEDHIIYREFHEDNENDEPRLESPKQKVKDPYKNFKIIHNTSVNNSNLFASPQMNFKNENSNMVYVGDENSIRENPNLPINSALKESTIQIAKINKMLEDHRKKKNQKLVEESMSSPVLGANFLQEMKDRLEHRRYNGVSKLINLDEEANGFNTGSTEENNYFRYDGPNVIESAETFGIKYPNNSQFTEDQKMSIDMNTDRGGERLLNPHSARDTKFSSDNKGFSQLPSSSKNTNTKPSIPKYRMEKNEVKEVLINRIEKEEQMNLLNEIKKRMPNQNPTSKPNIPKDNSSSRMKENINNGNLSMERKKPNLITEKPYKTTEKKYNHLNKTNDKLEKSLESKSNKASFLQYKSKDMSSKDSSIQIPNLFEQEKPKSAGIDRKKSPEQKKPVQEEKRMLLNNLPLQTAPMTNPNHSNNHNRTPANQVKQPQMPLQSTQKAVQKEQSKPEPTRVPEKKAIMTLQETKSMGEMQLKKNRPAHLEDTIPHQEISTQQRTPTNGSMINLTKEQTTPKQVYLKINEQMMSTKSNMEDDSVSAYTDVLTKWFGKQPKHEPLKSQIAKLSKLNNKSQSNMTDTNLESPFANNSSTITKDKRSFLEAQKLEFTPDSQMPGSGAKEEKILASQKRIQNFAGEPVKTGAYLRRDATPKETSQTKTAKSKSPAKSIPAAPKEIHHKKTQSLKDMKVSQTSLMNSLKLRIEKLSEKKEPVQVSHSNKNSISTKPKLDISTDDKPKWSDYNIYERNNMWASAKNSKIEGLVSERQKRELEGCTFRPSTITSKIFYSTLKANEHIPTVRKQSEHEVPERESPTRDPDNLLSERTTSRRRSISREKKDINSYKDLYKFRKNWADVSGEMPSYTKRNTTNYHTEGNDKGIPKNFFSAPSRKTIDNMNETIKLQNMISQWKNHL